MKVLLVQPPRLKGPMTFAAEPLGLESLAAAARGHEVRLYDMRFDRRPLARALGTFEPDVVGVTGFTPDFPNVLAILRETKRLLPRARTVVGGYHATLEPADFDLPGTVDAVVLGMGEETFPELLAAWSRGAALEAVSGLALPGGDGVAYTEPRAVPERLDDFPLPRRDLGREHARRHRYLGRPISLLSISRGCPHRCTFCSHVRFTGGAFVARSPESVLRELRQVPERLVRLIGSNTFADVDGMQELCRLVEGSRIDKRFFFDIRSSDVVKHADLVARWRRAGLEIVAVGFEYVGDSRLRAIKKGTTVAKHLEAIGILHELGLKIQGSFMVDPDFAHRDFDELRDFVLGQKIHFAGYLIKTPLPGTALRDELADQITSSRHEEYDLYHTVLPTRLGRREFYRRYLELYRDTYRLSRFAAHARDRLLRGDRRSDTPLAMLAAAEALTRLSWKKLAREYDLG